MKLQQTPYLNLGPYQEIISGIGLILSIGNGVIKVTGPSGAGKSSLIRQLNADLKQEGQDVVMFYVPPKSAQDLHDTITRQLRLGADLGFRKALGRHLLTKPKDQQHLIIIFDDVDQMTEETLLAVSLLRSITNNNEEPMVSLVLCGTAELNTKLGNPVFDALVQDLTLSYELNPLRQEQLERFTTAAINELQLKLPTPLKPELLAELHGKTEGFPEAILNELAELSKQPARPDYDDLVGKNGALATKASASITLKHAEDEPNFAEDDDIPAPWQRYLKPVALAVSVAVAGIVLYPQLDPWLQRFGIGSSPQPLATSTTLPVSPAEPEIESAAPEASPVAQISEAPAPAPSQPELNVSQATPAAPEISAQDSATPAPESAVAVSLPEAVPAQELSQSDPATPVVQGAPGQLLADAPPVTTDPDVEPAAALQTAATAPSVSITATQSSLPQPRITAPLVAGRNPTQTELESIVGAWLAAWQSKDLGAYFDFYHTDFAPLYQPTRASWRNNRAGSISRPATIAIENEPLVVASADDLGVRVQFWMNYQTSNYSDRTLKELVIGRDVDGQFRILQEYNRQVMGLPREPLNNVQQIALAAPSAPVAAGPTASTPTQTRIAAPITLLSAVENLGQAQSSVALSPDELGTINAFVTDWLTAWQNQDVNNYLRQYRPDFSPPGKTRQEWEAERTTRITRPIAIQMSMGELQVLSYKPLLSTVNFLLEYHSSYYADKTLKELVLEKSSEGSWLISTEKNKSVEILPLSRLLRMREMVGIYQE